MYQEAAELDRAHEQTQVAQRALVTAVTRLLLPIARLLLRHGMPFQAFAQIGKRAYLQAVADDFKLQGKRQTKARIALLTGMTRPDVRDLLHDMAEDEFPPPERWNRAAAVLQGWADDPEFHNRKGQPAPLTYKGSDAEFAALVRKYGADIPMRAVLDELRRVECAELCDDGNVHLLKTVIEPEAGSLPAIHALGIKGADEVTRLTENI